MSKRMQQMAGLSLALVLGSGAVAWHAWAQPHRGGGDHDCPCHGGPAASRAGSSHQKDMADIHALFSDPSIRRVVTEIPGGVSTLTESANPQGVAMLQKHVAAMHERVEHDLPIHMRDPLFAELFAHASEITMTVENTDKGVRVVETSTNPYVTKLIRAHAAVVTKFIAEGRREMHVDHAVPSP